jgi:hypothetical protein
VYGMIHKAARDMAIARLGEDEWRVVADECALTSHHMITTAYFDDAVILGLVAALARRMEMTDDQALEAFGVHWIRYAAASDYSRVISMAGDDIETFIDNLDRMHASIKSTMPLARMPSFRLLAADAEGLDVLYQSERDGLAPFVLGILNAVAARYGERMRIHSQPRDDGVLFTLRRNGSVGGA